MRHGTEQFFLRHEGMMTGQLIPMDVLRQHMPEGMAQRPQRPSDPVPSEKPPTAEDDGTIRLQAENATLRHAYISNRHPGSTGDRSGTPAYADFQGLGLPGNLSDTYIEWTVDIEAAGDYTLTWRYALGRENRPLALTINGNTLMESMGVPSTGAWDYWNTLSQTVELRTGPNTIRLSATGRSGANFDYLEVASTSSDNAFYQRFQAESAVLRRVTIATQHPGATGAGPNEPEWKAYVDFTGAGASDNVDDTYIEWTTTLQKAGSYQLSWRYALADSDRPLALTINGTTVIPSISFPNTGGWSTWNIVSQEVTLEPGETTIRLSALGQSGSNIDYMDITPQETAPRVFCRLFEAGEQPDAAALVELGLAMETETAGNIDATGDSDIPAGYTYLGQFIDHDITSDPTDLSDSGTVDPMLIENQRSPSLDLDSVYGLGPVGNPNFYEEDGVHLKVGMTTPTPRADAVFPNDLLRDDDKKAIIGDPRNDENLAVAQTHLAVIQFHNAMVDKIQMAQPDLSDEALFEAARQEVVLHYQSIVLHDFLPRIAQADVIEHVFTQGRQLYTDAFRGCMPIEFSVAAYRLGHSMVRPVYEWNRVFRTGGLADATMELLFEFSEFSGDFSSAPTLPSDWIIDWTRFYDFANVPGVDSHADLNFARDIDAKLSFALKDLPEFRGQGIPEIFISLATRNLLRGRLLQLPTGQAVAQALVNAGVPFEPLTPEEIAAGPHAEIVTRHGFDRQTPLWYYILKEAKVKNDGNKLGPVGSWLLAEVFVGLSDHSRTPLRQMRPSLVYSMPELLNFVGDLNPIGD